MNGERWRLVRRQGHCAAVVVDGNERNNNNDVKHFARDEGKKSAKEGLTNIHLILEDKKKKTKYSRCCSRVESMVDTKSIAATMPDQPVMPFDAR